MAQHEWFMMSNAWLAKTSLIDSELLIDPLIDTCEDLYLELQLAQRTHFAFSVELTCIHHFHSLGNSSIVDRKKHVPDTQRIALRNFSRTFVKDTIYDTQYNRVGRNRHTAHFTDPFYPARSQKKSFKNLYRKFIINLKYFGFRKALQKISERFS